MNDHKALTNRTGIEPQHLVPRKHLLPLSRAFLLLNLDDCVALAKKLEDIQPLIRVAVAGKRIVGHQLWRDFNGERADPSVLSYT